MAGFTPEDLAEFQRISCELLREAHQRAVGRILAMNDAHFEWAERTDLLLDLYDEEIISKGQCIEMAELGPAEFHERLAERRRAR